MSYSFIQDWTIEKVQARVIWLAVVSSPVNLITKKRDWFARQQTITSISRGIVLATGHGFRLAFQYIECDTETSI